MSDEVTLELPRERAFYGVAHLVVGGLAVRFDLTFEHLEDLQLALAELLERQEGDDVVTVTVRVHDDVVEATIGPFDAQFLAELQHDSRGDGVGLRRLLDTVVDRVEVTERDGAPWVELVKRLERV